MIYVSVLRSVVEGHRYLRAYASIAMRTRPDVCLPQTHTPAVQSLTEGASIVSVCVCVWQCVCVCATGKRCSTNSEALAVCACSCHRFEGH